MITHSGFTELKQTVGSEKNRLPIFFDFTVGNSPEDFTLPQFIDGVVSRTADMVDGIIVLPKNVPTNGALNGKEIWARADWTSIFNPTVPGKVETVVPLINPQYWDRQGVSGVVGTLVLGNSSINEADNVQYLASQRTHSFNTGVPMGIDLHVLSESEDGCNLIEIVELGLTLAVELGSDFVIIPGGEYLTKEHNIATIAELPILVRQSLCEITPENKPSDHWDALLAQVDGVVFTDTLYWTRLVDNSRILQVG